MQLQSRLDRTSARTVPGPSPSAPAAPVAPARIAVSLIVPAHNEEHRLRPTLETYADALVERYGDEAEILVVANACTDGTVDVAREVAEDWPLVLVVDIPDRVGKGGAIVAGFGLARGERVAFADADGATAPESLLQILDALDEADSAIGSRRLPASSVVRHDPTRRVLSGVFGLAVRHGLGLPFRDTQCGAKAFRADVARTLARQTTERRWAFDVDLLMRARVLGYSVAELPIRWADQPGSQLRLVPTAREVVGALWRLRRAQRVALAESTATGPASVAQAPMRILALNWRCHRHPQAGGAEVNLFEQARRWADEGHEVTVLCADPGRSFAPDRMEDLGAVRVVRMGGRFSVYGRVALYLLRNARRHDRVLDVANGVPFFAPLFCRLPVTLLVHHLHDRQWYAEFPRVAAAVGRLVERRVVPLIYRRRPVIAVSSTTRDALVGIGMRPERISVVYNGTTLPAGRLGADRPASELDARVVYVGRLKAYKRIDRLIRAVAALVPVVPGIELDIAGDGDARPELEALVAALGLTGRVRLRGQVSDETKVDLLERAAVFATPSMHEGWGLSVIEANAVGCPAVAYDVPGLSVAIQHDRTGLLAQDDEAFAGAIATILNDPERRSRYSAAARAWAELFDWDVSARETLRIVRAGPVTIPQPAWSHDLDLVVAHAAAACPYELHPVG